MHRAKVRTITMEEFRRLLKADEATGKPVIRGASLHELDNPEAEIVRVSDHPLGQNRPFRLNP